MSLNFRLGVPHGVDAHPRLVVRSCCPRIRCESSAPVRRSRRSRTWFDTDSTPSILSIAPPVEVPHIFTSTDTTSYADSSVNDDTPNGLDSFVGGGRFDDSNSGDFSGGLGLSSGGSFSDHDSSGGLGSAGGGIFSDSDSSGGLGSSIADAVDWSGADGFDSGSSDSGSIDFGSSSDSSSWSND